MTWTPRAWRYVHYLRPTHSPENQDHETHYWHWAYYNEVQNHQCSTANSSKSTSQLYTTTTTSVRKETSYCKCRRAYCRGVDCCYVSVTYCLLFRCCGVVLDIIYSAA